ncbi:MAG: hypothetical protein IJ475_00295 [Bacilli bacterium]|nr:hypothetical protein [Bacilli bacterium]
MAAIYSLPGKVTFKLSDNVVLFFTLLLFTFMFHLAIEALAVPVVVVRYLAYVVPITVIRATKTRSITSNITFFLVVM